MTPVDLGFIVVLGLLSGTPILWLFRRLTNPIRLRQTANRIIAHLLEINLFSHEPRIILRSQSHLLLENTRLLLQLLPPSLVLILLLAFLNCFLTRAPFHPGDTTLVTTSQSPLTATRNIAIDQPPVFIQTGHQFVWQIHINGPGNLNLPSTSQSICLGFPCLTNPFAKTIHISYHSASILHLNWLWWFSIASSIGAILGRKLLPAILLCLILISCAPRTNKKLIVLGIDGMDPSFVEQHWNALPNLKSLRDTGYFGRLATTMPPQSPVAWSTFITGLDPAQHGIFDFVERDPKTLALFSSMSKTEPPRFTFPLGPYLLPLSSTRIETLRQGIPFWRALEQNGIPSTVVHIPVNYPPEKFGRNLSGMGTPDLLGTQGTFTFYTDDPLESPRSVSGGRILKVELTNGRAILTLEGPPNPLRKDHAATNASLILDVDPTNNLARLQATSESLIIHQGEWSSWLRLEFPLISHISSLHAIVRIYAKQLHPGLQIYVSPINVDPSDPDLPISHPSSWSSDLASEIGPYSTLGIPEDTSALRQEVFNLPEFLQQSHLVFLEEAKLLADSLRHFSAGFLFFYFSSIDQNSHVLFAQHDDELLKIYAEVDQAIGTVRHAHPDAELLIISDHGFAAFTRAVNLNTWLSEHGYQKPEKQAYAVGLNGLYLKNRALIDTLRTQLLAWRDPANNRPIIETIATPNSQSPYAPDLIIGYAPGYRASWQTALGETPATDLEDNTDAWIADHCINPADVPGVLFSNRKIHPQSPRLQDVTAAILHRFNLPPPAGYRGSFF